MKLGLSSYFTVHYGSKFNKNFDDKYKRSLSYFFNLLVVHFQVVRASSVSESFLDLEINLGFSYYADKIELGICH